MALWGDKDNISVGTGATAYISSYTKNETYGGYPVVGSGSVWGSSGYAQVGDVIRFGNVGNSVAGVGGTYYGEAIINYIASTTSCYIASPKVLSQDGVPQRVLLLSLPYLNLLHLLFKIPDGVSVTLMLIHILLVYLLVVKLKPFAPSMKLV